MKAYTYEKSHRVTTDITYVQQHTGDKKWKDKIPKALFRGRDSNEGRLKLAEWNKTEPLLDAGITSYNFRAINETKWGPKADFVPLSKMGDWKYTVNSLVPDGQKLPPGLYRYAAVVSYDGSDFHGFQRQKHSITVQEELEAALSYVANQGIRVAPAGRTDTGVHACYQVVHFDSPVLRSASILFCLYGTAPFFEADSF